MLTNNEMYDHERRKDDFNTKLGDFDGFEVWGQGTQTFIINIEGNIIVKLLVKNTSSEDVAFSIKDINEEDCSGEYTKCIMDFIALCHPNGISKYVLTAGSEKMIEVDFSLAHYSIESDLMMGVMGKMMKSMKKGEGGKSEAAGFELNDNMMQMMNGFSLLRAINMASGMMNMEITKEQLLDLNAKLNKIKKKKK